MVVGHSSPRPPPRPLESSPTLPPGCSSGWQIGSYLFFFLMYKTCKRRSSVRRLGREPPITRQFLGTSDKLGLMNRRTMSP